MRGFHVAICVLMCWAGLTISCKERGKKPAEKPQQNQVVKAVGVAFDKGVAVLPEKLTGFAVLDLHWLRDSVLDNLGRLLKGVEPDTKKMLAEIAAVCKSRIGIDCTRARWAAGYLRLGETEEWGTVIQGEFGGPLKGEGKQEIAGIAAFKLHQNLYVTQMKNHLLFGSPAGIRTLIEVQQGKQKRLSDSPLMSTVAQLAPKLGSPRAFTLMFDLRAVPKKLPFEIHQLALAVRPAGQVVVLAHGPQEALQGLRQLIVGTMQSSLAKVTQTKEQMVASGPLYMAIAMILATTYHQAANQRLTPKLEEQNMWLELDLSGFNTMVPMMGVMSAVAIPAFLKYIKKAKTAEVHDGLARLYRGAKAFAETERVDQTGQRVPCQFPPSVDWTPTGSPCDHPDSKFPVNAAAWDQPSWKGLLFSISDEHYFQYRVTRRGIGNNSRLIIEGRADLDCDGQFSNFRLEALLQTKLDNPAVDCEVRRGPIATTDEYE